MALPKRSRKAWIQFGIALAIGAIVLVVAVVVIFMVFSGLNSQNQTLKGQFLSEKEKLEQKVAELNEELNKKAPELRPKQVEVSAAINAGIPIDANALTVVELPEGEQAASGSFTSIANVIGKVPKRNLFPGEVVTNAKLINTDEMLPLEHGKRAITLQMNPVTMVDGAVFEGAMIDVLGTFDEQKLTRTLLSNVRVIKVPGTDGEESSSTSKRVAGNFRVTLEVTPQQAEVLALASLKTQLHFTLRPFGETDSPTTAGVDTTQLAEGLLGRSASSNSASNASVAGNGELNPPTITPAPNADKFTMEIFRGTANESQEFERIGATQ